MEKLHKKVIKILEAEFQNLQDGLEERNGRVTGFIAASAFDKLEDQERQAHLWSILEKGLTDDELLRIGPVATLGEKEAAFPFVDD